MSTSVLPPVQKVSQTTFLGVMWAAVATSCLFVIFRLVVRVRSFKKLQVDDYLVVAAWCMFLASSIVWQIKAYILYWLYDVVHGRLQHLTGFLREYPTFMPHIVTWNVLFYSCLWTIKFSFLVFFRRLQSRVERKQRIWWWVVFTITVITWVACIADIDYNCSLRSATYILTECPSPGPVQFQNRTFYANMAIDVLTDILIISIPVMILRHTQIPSRKKSILLAIFSATILIMAVAIIRVTLVKGTEIQLQEASIDWLYLWSNVEMGVAIIVACVGSFRQLFLSTRNQDHAAPVFMGGRNGSGYRPGQKTGRSWLFRDLFSGFSRLTSSSGSSRQKSSQESQNEQKSSPQFVEIRHHHSDVEANLLAPDAVHVRKTVTVSLSD